MDTANAPGAKTQTKPGRTARLKAALKANMARRKAQARARGAAKPGAPSVSEERDG